VKLNPLTSCSENSIRSIELTETFHQEDNDKLTAEEEKEAEQILKDEQLKRTNPAAYRAIVSARDHPHVCLSQSFPLRANNADDRNSPCLADFTLAKHQQCQWRSPIRNRLHSL